MEIRNFSLMKKHLKMSSAKMAAILSRIDELTEQGNHWPRQWLGACSAPNHYLNHCGLIVSSPGTNTSENLIKRHFLKESAFGNDICKMLANLFRSHYVKNRSPKSTCRWWPRPFIYCDSQYHYSHCLAIMAISILFSYPAMTRYTLFLHVKFDEIFIVYTVYYNVIVHDMSRQW